MRDCDDAERLPRSAELPAGGVIIPWDTNLNCPGFRALAIRSGSVYPELTLGSAEPCLGAVLCPDTPCSSPDYTVWIEGCARIPRSSRINLPQSNSVDKVVPEVELDGWGCLHCSP